MMNFNIDDRVSAIDEDFSGNIVAINEDTISVEGDDGFVLEFSPNELILEKKPLQSGLFSEQSVKAVILEKEASQKRKMPRFKPRERYQPPMEVDLHIHQLTEKDHRLSNHEKLTLQIDTARRQLEFAIKKRIPKVVFIHGKGEGVLKMELEYLFGRYNNVKYYDADYKKYGIGATEVHILQNVAPN